MVPLIALRNVHKAYEHGGESRSVLRGITAEFSEGEMAAIRGRSGSGKTTLLNLLSGLDQPTSGIIQLSGADFSTLSDHERTEIRREMEA